MSEADCAKYSIPDGEAHDVVERKYMYKSAISPEKYCWLYVPDSFTQFGIA